MCSLFMYVMLRLDYHVHIVHVFNVTCTARTEHVSHITIFCFIRKKSSVNILDY